MDITRRYVQGEGKEGGLWGVLIIMLYFSSLDAITWICCTWGAS
jgi:hypothetical protein